MMNSIGGQKKSEAGQVAQKIEQRMENSYKQMEDWLREQLWGKTEEVDEFLEWAKEVRNEASDNSKI